MANIFRTASLWLKIAIICMAIGLLLFVIGFATNSWKVSRGRSYGEVGIWGGATPNGQSYQYDSRTLNDFHKAFQAMECLGLIFFFLAIVTLLLYMCVDACRRRDYLQACTAFTFAGAVFACIGFALISSDNRKNFGIGRDVGWSMGIAIAGTVAYGIAGVVLVIQLIGR